MVLELIGRLLGEVGGEMVRETTGAFSLIEWIRLIIGSVVCAVIAQFIIALFGVPVDPGFAGSLLAGGMPVMAVFAVVFALIAMLIAGTIIAGRVGVEGAVLCAAVGLAAVSVRCGPIGPVLMYAGGRGVFVVMAIEAVLLAGIVGAGWWALERLAIAASKGVRRLAVPSETTDATTGQKFSVLGVGVLVAALIELILIQVPGGKQAMCGVVVGGYVGAWAAYSFLPLPEGAWYWTAPSVVGVIGYLFAFFAGDVATSGDLHNWLAPLARPTPLDYASVGTAAALLGHWSCRRWAQADEAPVLADPDSPPA